MQRKPDALPRLHLENIQGEITHNYYFGFPTHNKSCNALLYQMAM